MNIRVKRVYEAEAPDDGVRVLVDRLWPRGLSKARAAVDIWLRDVAPSDGLRTWFGHVPERFDSFTSKYRAELEAGDAVAELEALVRSEATVTLLYAAKDTEHNQAVVLAQFLEQNRTAPLPRVPADETADTLDTDGSAAQERSA